MTVRVVVSGSAPYNKAGALLTTKANPSGGIAVTGIGFCRSNILAQKRLNVIQLCAHFLAAIPASL